MSRRLSGVLGGGVQKVEAATSTAEDGFVGDGGMMNYEAATASGSDGEATTPLSPVTSLREINHLSEEVGNTLGF